MPKNTLGSDEKASQGHEFFTAKNPPFGSVFNYYLKDGLTTAKEKRQKLEKESIKNNKALHFVGWDVIEAERLEQIPKIWLTIKDSQDNVVRRIKGSIKKGFNQAVWDLRYPASLAITTKNEFSNNEPKGMMVAPGTYTVTMTQLVNGKLKPLSQPQSFKVNRLRKGTLEGSEPEVTVEFWQQISKLQKQLSAGKNLLANSLARVKHLQLALSRSYSAPGNLDVTLEQIILDLNSLDIELNGQGSKNQVGEKNKMSISDRLSAALMGTNFSTYGPTKTHKRSLEIGREQFDILLINLNNLINKKIPQFENDLQKSGAPWIPGAKIPES